ncbi:MAG: homoserine kinase [Candidatus Micrarchaeota archaeon]
MIDTVSKSEIKRILANYPIGGIKRIQRLGMGQMNLSYKISTAKGKYVIRINRHRSRSEIEYELDFLKKLWSRKLPVQKIIYMKNGDRIFKFKQCWGCVFKYIEGSHPTAITSNRLIQIGEFLGSAHSASENFRPTGKRESQDLPEIRKRFQAYKISILKSDLPDKEKFIKEFQKDMKEVRLPNSLPRGPIHCDVKPENVLFLKNSLSGVIDFDYCFEGPFIMDLMKTVVWWCFENNALDTEKYDALMNGYTKARKLNEFEEAYLNDALKYAFLQHIWRDLFLYSKGDLRWEFPRTVIFDMYKSYENWKNRYG